MSASHSHRLRSHHVVEQAKWGENPHVRCVCNVTVTGASPEEVKTKFASHRKDIELAERAEDEANLVGSA